MTGNQKLMALGDAVGGFALAILFFSYWGELDLAKLGWFLIGASFVLQIPYMQDILKKRRRR